MKTKLFFLAIIFLTQNIAKAQDKIYKKTGVIIKAKVSEVGLDEIKYHIFGDTLSPIYTIDKGKINKIVYENGRVESYLNNSSLKDPELYADQLKKAIKINFLAPQLGYFSIEFEKNIKPGKSLAFELALIGVGRNLGLGTYYKNGQYFTAKRGAVGAGVSAGYKFCKLPSFVSSGIKYTHIMQGMYAKPTFTIGDYSENVILSSSSEISKRNIFYSSLIIELGKQWVFADKFVLDSYFGMGYMVDNHKSNDGNYNTGASNNFTGTRLGDGAGLGLSFGIKVGMLFK